MLKPIYKTLRSVIIAVIMLVVVIYVGLYVLLSVPMVQEKVKILACNELSSLLGGKLEIERLNVAPFSEVLLNGVSLKSPQGEQCAFISKMSVGLDLWYLLSERKIVFNYAEIIGLDTRITQNYKDGALNIQFLIDALSPKDKTRPPSKFDLRFRNIIIRDSKAKLIRTWMKSNDGTFLKFSEIGLDNLRLDLSIPTLKNNLFRFDIRNMQAKVSPGVDLRGLSAEILFQKGDGLKKKDILSVKKLNIDLPGTAISFGDVNIDFQKKEPIAAVVNGHLTPSDFSEVLPQLSTLDYPWSIEVDAMLNENEIEINSFSMKNDGTDSEIGIKGFLSGWQDIKNVTVVIKQFNAKIAQNVLTTLASIISNDNGKIRNLIAQAGNISVDITGSIKDADEGDVVGRIESELGTIELEGEVSQLKSMTPAASLSLVSTDVALGKLSGIEKIGNASFIMEANVRGFDRNVEGEVEINTDYIYINGKEFAALNAFVIKKGDNVHTAINASDPKLHLDLDADCHIAGQESKLDATLDLAGFNTNIFGLKGKLADSQVRLNLDVHIKGDNIDNVTGMLHMSDLNVRSGDSKTLNLHNLSLNIDTISKYPCENHVSPARQIVLRSDWMDATVSGHIHPNSLTREVKRMISKVVPSLIPMNNNVLVNNDVLEIQKNYNDFIFKIDIKSASDPYDYFKLPVCPLTQIPIQGYIDTDTGRLELSFSTPHIRQGKDKLIRDTSLKINLDSFIGMAKINATTLYPAKKGDVQLAISMTGVNDKVNANVQLNPTFESSLKGGMALATSFSRIPNPLTQREDLAVHVDILPSIVKMKEMAWNISNGNIDYFGKTVSVNNFKVEHDDQYVKIDGRASESPDDYLTVKLNDIDLDYIFGMLNINYVTFGGMATGEVVGRQLFTKQPEAYTKFLRVKNLSYNGALLGDGDLASSYFPNKQKVGIYAYIKDPLTRERKANIDGGIWITRDSLSFNFDANKVNLQLMKPFVSAFCSDLRGLGSGRCKLYGTFSDIDLVGNLKADTISMKIDFTNTWYHAGGDSVVMGKGLIDIPPLTLYDTDGHTAELSGWLRHRYFHEPEFNFKIRNAKSILCYDTNERMNPLWYGKIYGSGNGQIAGRPGLVEIDLNMTTQENSRFYYVISDSEETDSYSFLSFTDKRKEEENALVKDTMPDYIDQFLKKQNEMEEGSSNVLLNIKGSVTNAALVTLIMDPIAGDKITARGHGALQMDYNMDANDVRMIGTYTLEEGNYFFTLQDIIIKNFVIRPGSKIKFDGDPLNANLDIAATYRVNTNLTDLDKSFSTDKELNRTNVPVDAMLMVDGPMTHPDITFDIELPTLTSDVERKVKSIVSTNDMMSRQIIYLLALNRFYTPEYTGSSTSGGEEMSSLASSTLSSQLSNILSNMTDKLEVAPSFRSDKGNFSDMEFDLALSSRLLNNRLLINGNFGYRDRETSNTQFIGDFDIEYLLNRSGNLRLKAYNHFNDQNYYLRSALTTQGVGVIFRKDFDHIFNFGKNKKSILPDSLLINNNHGDGSSVMGDSKANEAKD